MQWRYACLLLPVLLAAGAAHPACPSTRIHLNQVGFLPDSVKLGILSAASGTPVNWRLVDGKGEERLAGKTQVYGDDPVSGENVHRIVFDGFGETGAGFRLEADCAASEPFDIAPQLFDSLPYDALAYFYQNRAGMPIDAKLAGSEALARPASHVDETVTCRSGTDPLGNDWPGCSYELDVTGGWYDAGDHGKYVVNGGIATWTLLNIHERQEWRGLRDLFGDGQATIPEADNGISDLLDEARYELEFLLSMQAPDGAVLGVPVGVTRPAKGLRFSSIDASGMAHHKVADLEWTPLPTPPHEDTEERVLYPVSTAATLNLAAVAAQCARVYRSIDAAFADRCLHAARRAWDGAQRNPEVYFVAPFSGSGTYGDGDVSDEFFWAAAELFVTTGEAAYRDFLVESPWFDTKSQRAPSWQFTAPLGLVSLAFVDNALESVDVDVARAGIMLAANTFLDERQHSGFRIPFSADQLVWGSNSVLLNRAIMLALAADLTGNARYHDAVIDVLDYLLGRNPLDVSYVSGYGDKPMQNPHHRFWVPSADARLSAPPPGVLSGGPNNTAMVDPVAQKLRGQCAPLACWRDDVEAYSLNEVAINWNAPLVWVAAYLNDAPEKPD